MLVSDVFMYDGFELQKILRYLNDDSEILHIIITNRLTCTFDERDGRYHARVTGSYENTLSGTVRNFDNPDDAISAALDSSPGGRPPSAAELLVKVGEELEPAGWYGID